MYLSLFNKMLKKKSWCTDSTIIDIGNKALRISVLFSAESSSSV